MYILNKKQSIIFEIIELFVLFCITIYYLIKKEIIFSVIWLIPFIEHIRQITLKFRQNGGGTADILTIIYFISTCIYSYFNKKYISFSLSFLAIIIHIITITTIKTFMHIVSIEDIHKLSI